MFSWIKNLFGSSDKGIVSEVSDVVDKWVPSKTSEHKMSIEDLKAGDDSQDSARKMELKSHGSWFDILIDGLNRLPRPVITAWVVGMLFGVVPEPSHLTAMNPMTLNIMWTVISFWFGSRVLFKDIPAALKALKAPEKPYNPF